jgi:hypothetical protein
MLISPDYRRQNEQLHDGERFGNTGHVWADAVRQLTRISRDILDYGCGQRTLEKSLGFAIKNYDPCIAGFDGPAPPADIVVCTDVLEHVEPECLDAVLDDLKRVTLKIGFFVIHTQPALKTLPDGRNAHLIQKPSSWWLPRLCQRFEVAHLQRAPGGFLVMVTPRVAA